MLVLIKNLYNITMAYEKAANSTKPNDLNAKILIEIKSQPLEPIFIFFIYK